MEKKAEGKSMKKSRGSNWGDEETKALIQIWREPEIQARIEDKKNTRKEVWEEISVRLHDHGFIARTGTQIYVKIKDLKRHYKAIHDTMGRSGAGVINLEKFPYYWAIHDIMGHRPVVNPPAGHVGESGPLDEQNEGKL